MATVTVADPAVSWAEPGPVAPEATTAAPKGLFRTGHALILSSALTSGLGMVYWLIAAHEYSARDVGLNTAAISAMMFLSGASQLNLSSALTRFIPLMRRRAASLVRNAYCLTAAIAGIASVIFLVGINHWAPRLDFVESVPARAIWFVAAAMVWCVFVLEDSVLTAVRQAVWVPVENAGFAVAKIVLLIALAAALPTYGIFFSWTVAALVAIIPTNLLLFRRLLPRHRAGDAPSHDIPRRHLSKFVAGDYVGALLWLACVTLLPIVITDVVGPVATAYFSLSWNIALALYLASANMGASLVVEAAADDTKIGIYSYRTLVHTLGLILPVAGVLLVGAPEVLRPFGERYAAGGTTVLRLLALSAIPNVINTVYVSVARLQRRTWNVVVVMGLLFVILMALSIPMLGSVGIVGVGWAWLISQTIVASLVSLPALRRLWAEVPALNPWRDWQDGIGRTLVRFGVPALLGRLRRGGRRRLAQSAAVLPAILAATPDASPDWDVQSLVSTVTDVTVATVGPRDGAAAAVLKLPRTAFGVASQQSQLTVLDVLGADERLGDWRLLLPQVIAAGRLDEQTYLLERAMPGRPSDDLLSSADPASWVLPVVVDAIAPLHELTAVTTHADRAAFGRWIEGPLARLEVVRMSLPAAARRTAIDRVRALTGDLLAGQALAVSWVHGDYTPSNIFVDAESERVTAILDWDRARPDHLAVVDILHLLVAIRARRERSEIGDVVRRLLAGEPWTREERQVIRNCAGGGDLALEAPMVLLCWLLHVDNNLDKSLSFASHHYWIRHNIEAVLSCLT